VELTPIDAVSLAHVLRVGMQDLTKPALASRLLVPRIEYYGALEAALRAAALASVGVGCLPVCAEGEYEEAIEELEIGD
jgi:hypothetical protein